MAVATKRIDRECMLPTSRKFDIVGFLKVYQLGHTEYKLLLIISCKT